nr:uncharacterized protein LOC109157228 [Ipomoea batatas]
MPPKAEEGTTATADSVRLLLSMKGGGKQRSKDVALLVLFEGDNAAASPGMHQLPPSTESSPFDASCSRGRPLTRHKAEARRETPEIARETQEEQDDRSKKRNKLVIHMIYGGPVGGDSALERKRWARQLYIGAIQHRVQPNRGRRDPIIFSDDDLPDGPTPHRDVILIAMDVNGATVRRVFVDTSSSVNVMYLETFTKLGLTKENLHQVRTPLTGFTGDSIELEGCITLPIEIREYPKLSQGKQLGETATGASHGSQHGRQPRESAKGDSHGRQQKGDNHGRQPRETTSHGTQPRELAKGDNHGTQPREITRGDSQGRQPAREDSQGRQSEKTARGDN